MLVRGKYGELGKEMKGGRGKIETKGERNREAEGEG